MNRTMRLSGDSKDDSLKFQVLYLAMIISGNRQREKREEQRRRENAVLDKLEAIGVRPGEVPDEVEYLELRPGPQILVLDKPEFDLVKRYLDEATWPASKSKWMVSSRQAQPVIDWFGDLKIDEPARPAAAPVEPQPTGS